MKKLITLALALIVFASSVLSSAAAGDLVAPFDQRDHPVYLIASYYNAIALRDYARAYNYWNGNAPEPYQAFVQGFAYTQSVRALARLPLTGGVAAGTEHAEVPVVVFATLTNGAPQIFAGCFHVARTNVPVGNPPVVDPNWRIESAQMFVAATADFNLATSACSRAESFPTAGRVDNRQFAPDLISSYYDAIAARDYVRAYNYWQGGPPRQTYAQFVQGFMGTDNIGVVMALNFHIGAAAGSAYADNPLLITATSYGVPQVFVGCVVTRQSNVPVGNTLDPNWHLYSANISVAASWEAGAQSVWNACLAL
jgi:hypothetical protein